MFVFKQIIVLSCAWLGALYGLTATAAVSRDDSEVQQWLNKHAQQVQGVEVPAARQRAVGDLDGDGRSDMAVLYTLKLRSARGGEMRYLAAFKRQRAAQPPRTGGDRLRYHAHILVSGPGAGEANRITILNRAVVVEMLTFAPGDEPCCPTRASKRRYRVAARGLVLMGPERARRAR